MRFSDRDGTPTRLFAHLCEAGLASRYAIAYALALLIASPSHADQAADTEVFELRTYHVNEGKLPALHTRFRDHTIRLFSRHGIRSVMYWTPTDTPDTLIYVVAHKNRASIESAWRAFVSDPEWQAAYAASIADGQLVKKIDSVFMDKTDYSP